mmetsp:Transcript_75232/g.176533  ORF Transcript_75232/g.176533 Transcript_75232/m.176533 type:complete len:209 (+) Transcript_75232:2412-3038(+)
MWHEGKRNRKPHSLLPASGHDRVREERLRLVCQDLVDQILGQHNLPEVGQVPYLIREKVIGCRQFNLSVLEAHLEIFRPQHHWLDFCCSIFAQLVSVPVRRESVIIRHSHSAGVQVVAENSIARPEQSDAKLQCGLEGIVLHQLDLNDNRHLPWLKSDGALATHILDTGDCRDVESLIVDMALVVILTKSGDLDLNFSFCFVAVVHST